VIQKIWTKSVHCEHYYRSQGRDRAVSWYGSGFRHKWNGSFGLRNTRIESKKRSTLAADVFNISSYQIHGHKLQLMMYGTGNGCHQAYVVHCMKGTLLAFHFSLYGYGFLESSRNQLIIKQMNKTLQVLCFSKLLIRN
jgi:hypothetical protein